ncbi:MAG: hypothetical protein NC177_01730 [Ruminococcus flavefaciens]|nr:hypothetical protein [Ruminococcus flavefaciens]
MYVDDGARLEIMHRPNIPDSMKNTETKGYTHIAFSLGSAENVDVLTEKLKSDSYYKSCIADSEGNRIELTI